jgi:hypothetical protein
MYLKWLGSSREELPPGGFLFPSLVREGVLMNGLDSVPNRIRKNKGLGVEGHRYHGYRARILMVTYVVVFLILLLAFGGLRSLEVLKRDRRNIRKADKAARSEK